nr:hypothetical protein [Lactobacillus agrestimuris]
MQMLGRSFNSCHISIMKQYHSGTLEYSLLKNCT